jgi:hypothetical protein
MSFAIPTQIGQRDRFQPRPGPSGHVPREARSQVAPMRPPPQGVHKRLVHAATTTAAGPNNTHKRAKMLSIDVRAPGESCYVVISTFAGALITLLRFNY